MGGHWLIALLALPGACQEPPSYEQKLEIARHRIAQLERVVPRTGSGGAPQSAKAKDAPRLK